MLLRQRYSSTLKLGEDPFVFIFIYKVDRIQFNVPYYITYRLSFFFVFFNYTGNNRCYCVCQSYKLTVCSRRKRINNAQTFIKLRHSSTLTQQLKGEAKTNERSANDITWKQGRKKQKNSFGSGTTLTRVGCRCFTESIARGLVITH